MLLARARVTTQHPSDVSRRLRVGARLRGRISRGSAPRPVMAPAAAFGPAGAREGLRCDRDRIAALAGFDPLALAVPGRAELDAWLAHLDALGVPDGPVMHGHQGDAVAVHDPDGIQIRLYTTDPPR
jgi:catechol 2,3-dioxygenase-like lactoylglutathione lyase family enzyme